MCPFIQKRKQVPREKFPVSGRAGGAPGPQEDKPMLSQLPLPCSEQSLFMALSVISSVWPTQDISKGLVHNHANFVVVIVMEETP